MANQKNNEHIKRKHQKKPISGKPSVMTLPISQSQSQSQFGHFPASPYLLGAIRSHFGSSNLGLSLTMYPQRSVLNPGLDYDEEGYFEPERVDWVVTEPRFGYNVGDPLHKNDYSELTVMGDRALAKLRAGVIPVRRVSTLDLVADRRQDVIAAALQRRAALNDIEQRRRPTTRLQQLRPQPISTADSDEESDEEVLYWGCPFQHESDALADEAEIEGFEGTTPPGDQRRTCNSIEVPALQDVPALGHTLGDTMVPKEDHTLWCQGCYTMVSKEGHPQNVPHASPTSTAAATGVPTPEDVERQLQDADGYGQGGWYPAAGSSSQWVPPSTVDSNTTSTGKKPKQGLPSQGNSVVAALCLDPLPRSLRP